MRIGRPQQVRDKSLEKHSDLIALPHRILITVLILPLIYLSVVRACSQILVSTDRSSLFESKLEHVLASPGFFESTGRGERRAETDASASILKGLVSSDPFNSDYRHLLAREDAKRDLRAAEAMAQQAIAFSAIDPKNWLLLGWILGARGFVEQGYAAFDRAVMLDPERPDSLAQMGVYLSRAGMGQEGRERGGALYGDMALLSLRKAIGLDIELYRNPEVNNSLANLYRLAGSPGYAVHVLTKISNRAVLPWPMMLERLALFFELGEGVKAINAWKRSFNPKELSKEELDVLEGEIDRYDVPEFKYLSAQVHIAQGRHDQAVKELTSLVSARSGTAEYRVALASAYERMGNHKEALRVYEEALRLSPANQEAKIKVIGYYSKHSDREGTERK